VREQLQVGDHYQATFSMSQEDVERFVALSGDDNRIHSDQDAADKSPMGKIAVNAVPGFLPALQFSRVLGTIFPGHGTVYRNQNLYWRRPLFINTPYIVEVSVRKIEYPKDESGRAKAPRALLDTVIRDSVSGEVVLKGDAVILHNERL
jgi:acyl dehydratase